MVEDSLLRPLERRVLRLAGEGNDEAEIARRFRRSPEHVRRVLALTRIPRHAAHVRAADGPLRPLERRLLKWRDQGVEHGELASMFRRSADHVRQVETLARYKLAKLG